MNATAMSLFSLEFCISLILGCPWPPRRLCLGIAGTPLVSPLVRGKKETLGKKVLSTQQTLFSELETCPVSSKSQSNYAVFS